MTDSFYKEKKSRASDEVERVALVVVKLLKNFIKNYDHVANVYPNIGESFTATNENVLNLLRVFVAELIKLPLKQNSISKTIFAATHPKSLMPVRDKNENWLSIASNEAFPIKLYHHPVTPALSKFILKPIIGNCAMI